MVIHRQSQLKPTSDASAPDTSSPPRDRPHKRKTVARKSVGGRKPRAIARAEVSTLPALPEVAIHSASTATNSIAPARSPPPLQSPGKVGPTWAVAPTTSRPAAPSSSQQAFLASSDDELDTDRAASAAEVDRSDAAVHVPLNFGDAGGLDDEGAIETELPDVGASPSADETAPLADNVAPLPHERPIVIDSDSDSGSDSDDDDMAALALLDWDESDPGPPFRLEATELPVPSDEPSTLPDIEEPAGQDGLSSKEPNTLSIQPADPPLVLVNGANGDASPPAVGSEPADTHVPNGTTERSRSQSCASVEAIQTPNAPRQDDLLLGPPLALAVEPPVVVDRDELGELLRETTAAKAASDVLQAWSPPVPSPPLVITSCAHKSEQPPPSRRGAATRHIDHDMVKGWNKCNSTLTDNGPLHCAIFEAYISWATSLDEPYAQDIKVVSDRNGTTGPPLLEFQYSNDMLYHAEVPDPELGLGCDCEGPCDPNSTTCSCRARQDVYNYGFAEGFQYNTE